MKEHEGGKYFFTALIYLFPSFHTMLIVILKSFYVGSVLLVLGLKGQVHCDL